MLMIRWLEWLASGSCTGKRWGWWSLEDNYDTMISYCLKFYVCIVSIFSVFLFAYHVTIPSSQDNGYDHYNNGKLMLVITVKIRTYTRWKEVKQASSFSLWEKKYNFFFFVSRPQEPVTAAFTWTGKLRCASVVLGAGTPSLITRIVSLVPSLQRWQVLAATAWLTVFILQSVTIVSWKSM